ncbi:MAG: hypothetical protein R3C18_06920 [Planctomycetaceae bacterium]
MEQHLTVKEATQFSGKSESTIKRLIREIVNVPNHEDRGLILPTPADLEQRKAAGEPYVWKIDKALLEKRFPAEEMISESPEPLRTQSGGVSGDDRLISVLETTVTVLKEELIEKNKQIAEFQERQREQNLLIKNFQDQLRLVSSKSSTDEVVVNQPSEEGSHDAPRPTKTQQTKPSIWNREFHLFGRKRS